jgi:NAD(P)H-dependent FMN reductase
MSTPKIAIIIGSTRATRFGDKPAQWIADIASQRSDLEVEIVDLRDYPMPLFEEVASNAWVPTQNPIGVKWQQKLAEFDGYIFITAEYNHSITGALKNALDYAYTEWNRKVAAFVGYGGVGGARAVEHLRGIAAELQMATVRSAVHISGADYMGAAKGEKALGELEHLNQTANAMLADLAWWASALKTAREESLVEA